MISQAWERHRRDQLAVSVDQRRMAEVMETMWSAEMESYSQEVFLTELDLVHPLITEVYTDTEPVARAARRRGHRSGESLTLGFGWDFSLPSHRSAAVHLIKESKPYCVVLAFPCGPWSALMRLNPAKDLAERRRAAKVLVDFAAEVALLQLREGRHFIMENPRGSDAWKLPIVQRLLQHPRVRSVYIDQCAFGLKSAGGELHQKPTRLVTSSQALVSRVRGGKCDRSHHHAPVLGGRKITEPAGHYPDRLAQAMVQGLEDQFNFETWLVHRNLEQEQNEVMVVDPGDPDFEAEPSSGEEVDDLPQASEKLTIPAAIRNAVYRLHENTGHRSGRRLARALVVCGAPREAVAAARQLKCSVCAERRPPKAARPAGLPSVRDAGERAHIDLLIVEDVFRVPYVVCHITDSVTRYQMADILENKSTEAAILGAIVKSHAVSGLDGVRLALGEAVEAYNTDVNEEGVTPLQAVTGGMGANAFLSFKGQLTKCPLEHIRPASSLEQIAADSWEEAIREENMAILLVLLMVRDYLAKRRLFMELYRFLQLYLTPSPAVNQDSVEGGTAMPGTPEESVASASLPDDPNLSQPAFEALTMSSTEIDRIATETDGVHPLLRLQALAENDRRHPLECLDADHGSWDGRWSHICQAEWNLMRELGEKFPNGDCHNVAAVQTARKEYPWKPMPEPTKHAFREAAVKNWKAYVDNNAIKVLSLQESRAVKRELARRGELDRILQPRFVLTDKHDGLRTEGNPLPLLASARMVVPGFRDRANLEGRLRRDAPTGSRISQHLLFIMASAHPGWALISADVKSAFLKGDPYVQRELYMTGTNPNVGPTVPIPDGCLARVLKGVFGLADAPREWWLRLDRCLVENGWSRFELDGATWVRRVNGKLTGMIVAHVDDLLFTGDSEAERSLNDIGKELGFGSLERTCFVWCGKKIRRAEDGTIRLSMVEYHQNLKPMYLSRHRRSDPMALLAPAEVRQLRALLGSLQWLVAQLRFDMSYVVSSLQGESPTVGTAIRANSAVQAFKEDVNFEMVFRPLDWEKAGIMVVTDAALGNVTRFGTDGAAPLEKVFSQACYFVLVADADLMNGKTGRFNILDARGFFASLKGKSVVGKEFERNIDTVGLTVVVDAKDVYDKSNSDTASYGSQKSLAFTVAWMRAFLRRPNTALKWTSTENMWVDGGTKAMDLTHMRKIIKTGSWSVSYSPDFVKQVHKAAKKVPKVSACAVLPGDAVGGDDPILAHLMALGEQRGWHARAGVGINVATSAKSFRTPEPRFSAESLPLRTTFGRFQHETGQYEWRRLEDALRYGSLANPHGMIGRPYAKLAFAETEGSHPVRFLALEKVEDATVIQRMQDMVDETFKGWGRSLT
ncbi:unnamed protein product [Effrenium voratum]|nr:unnamed protein product [Effrenium voratum]